MGGGGGVETICLVNNLLGKGYNLQKNLEKGCHKFVCTCIGH